MTYSLFLYTFMVRGFCKFILENIHVKEMNLIM